MEFPFANFLDGMRGEDIRRQARYVATSAILLIVMFGCATQEVTQYPIPTTSSPATIEHDFSPGTFPENDPPIGSSNVERTPEEYARLGDTYRQQGNLSMAFTHYDRSLRLDPAQVETRSKLAELYMTKDRFKEAYDQFHIILDYDLEYAPAFEGMGRALFEQENLEGAEYHLKKALALDPQLWRACAYLGMVYDRQGKHTEAIIEYRLALRLKPGEPSLYNNLGVAYFLNEQYSSAVKALLQALEHGAISKKVYNNLGRALGRMGQYEEAWQAFRKGTNEPHAYNNLGMVYIETGQYPKAIACFQKAIELSETYYTKANSNLAMAKKAFEDHAYLDSVKLPPPHATCP